MKIYLAGFELLKNLYKSDMTNIQLLSSFWEQKNKKGIEEYIFKSDTIIDSGAYSTFGNINAAKKYDWFTYAKEYARFIKLSGKKLYFELDIDLAVGLKTVEDLRKTIEDITGIQSIQVWHKNRGWDYFLRMCEESKYVAIGCTNANAEGSLLRSNHKLIDKFIKTAHSKNVKIHGLGFTDTKSLYNLKFDSVDSTTWIGGGKYGTLYLFDGRKINTIKKKQKTIFKSYKEINLFNFNEWLKFQKYAEKNL